MMIDLDSFDHFADLPKPEAERLFRLLEDTKRALDYTAVIMTTDGNGLVLDVNKKFEELSGYCLDELIGKNPKLINSGAHPKSFYVNMWRTISSGQIWLGDICNRRKTGELYWVRASIVPFLGADGKPVRYVSIRHEITELKKAEQTILDQQEKLVTASRLGAIGEMAAAITHEINNPLGVILGRVEMLKSMLADGKYEISDIIRIADIIESTGQRIAKIVRSMKTMAHHETSQDAAEIVPVSQIVLDATDLCQHRFKNHGIQLKVGKISEDFLIECRSHLIVQILVNLLNNSFDAISNLPQKWVEIEVKRLEQTVQIVLTDSGNGIPKEVQQKMFNPFYSTKKVQYGTGMGLSISQGIARQNQGSLDYDSLCPHTRFILTLPLRLSSSV